MALGWKGIKYTGNRINYHLKVNKNNLVYCILYYNNNKNFNLIQKKKKAK